jgi:hypothetical protein
MNAGGFNGSHSHTFSLTYTAAFRQLRMIKANSDLSTGIPSLGLVLAAQSFGTLSQYFSGDGKILLANSSLSSGGGGTPGAAGTTSAGSHHHNGTTKGCGGQSCHFLFARYISTGAHTHTITPSGITNNILRMYLSAWSHASAAFPLETGMIAMYESLTPPAGWSLCDGTGGTPDMRNYFMEFGTTGNHGTSTGNGTVTPSWSGQNHGNHNHASGTGYTIVNGYSYHITNNHANGHPASQVVSHTPPYYALAFIKYTG